MDDAVEVGVVTTFEWVLRWVLVVCSISCFLACLYAMGVGVYDGVVMGRSHLSWSVLLYGVLGGMMMCHHAKFLKWMDWSVILLFWGIALYLHFIDFTL